VKRTTIVLSDENDDYLRYQRYAYRTDAKTIVNRLLDESRQLKREFKANEDYMHVTTSEKLEKAEADVYEQKASKEANT
jgi:hypothetical protein